MFWRSLSSPLTVNDGSPARLVEMFFVVGHRATTLSTGRVLEREPCVLMQFPSSFHPGPYVLPQGADAIAKRISSFCFPFETEFLQSLSMEKAREGLRESAHCMTTRKPFVFTLLAASLPSGAADRQEWGDPTDLLYCTAVYFDEVFETHDDSPANGTTAGVGPYAYCIVSRHPFVSAFGDLIVQIHDGEKAGATQCAGEMAISTVAVDAPSGDLVAGKADAGAVAWAAIEERLRRACVPLHATVPQGLAHGDMIRSRTAPLIWSGAGDDDDAHLRSRDRHARASKPRTVGPLNASGEVAGNVASAASHRISSYPTSHCDAAGETAGKRQEGSERTGGAYSLQGFQYPEPPPLTLPLWTNTLWWQQCRLLLDWAARPLFEHLGEDAVLRVLTALLLELKVVIVSRSVCLGAAVVLGAGALLWPFRWQHLLLPVCPLGVQDDIIDAPVPFLCALQKCVLDAQAAEQCYHPRRSTSRRDIVVCHVEAAAERAPGRGGGDGSSASDSGARLLFSAAATAATAPPFVLRRHCAAIGELRARQPELPVATREMCAEVRAAMLSLAQEVLRMSKSVRDEAIGSVGWLSQMELSSRQRSAMPHHGGNEESAFFEAFVHTQTCLMFLDGAAA